MPPPPPPLLLLLVFPIEQQHICCRSTWQHNVLPH
jgi:hypothetical protein